MLLIFFHLNIKMAIQKFTNFDNFLMYTGVRAVTIQPNKFVLSEVIYIT